MLKNRIAFIGCSAAKSAGLSRSADERYASQLFNARLEYCRQEQIGFFVLSARYGLLKSNERVREYDETMNSKSAADFLAWHIAIAKELIDQSADNLNAKQVTIELHAGQLYCEPLEGILNALGFNVVRPVRSMAIGKQLQFYSMQGKQAACYSGS